MPATGRETGLISNREQPLYVLRSQVVRTLLAVKAVAFFGALCGVPFVEPE